MGFIQLCAINLCDLRNQLQLCPCFLLCKRRVVRVYLEMATRFAKIVTLSALIKEFAQFPSK